MRIRTETSKGNGIDNEAGELTTDELRRVAKILEKYPHAEARTPASSNYNCHGLTFLSRRSWLIHRRSIDQVLTDDCYEEVRHDRLRPGDIAIYFSESGDPNHSGVVVQVNEMVAATMILSKWASASEVLHPLRHCPEYYGPEVRFYRCML